MNILHQFTQTWYQIGIPIAAFISSYLVILALSLQPAVDAATKVRAVVLVLVFSLFWIAAPLAMAWIYYTEFRPNRHGRR